MEEEIYNYFKYYILKFLSFFISDEQYRRYLYKRIYNKTLNLEEPKTFNEKIQWRVLREENNLYTELADKYLVRDYVKNKIGEDYLIKILGIYNSPEEINYDILPDRFVLKCNHDTGSVIICENKKKFNIKQANRKLKFYLKRNYYYITRERHYKKISPKILCEEYLPIFPTKEKEYLPEDYKFHVFNGKVEYLEIQFDRFGTRKINVYDTDWKLQPFLLGYENTKFKIKKPEKLNEMIKLAEQLAEQFKYCRVDFYLVNNKIYFGELTFTPCGGFDKFIPNSWDYKFGEKWIIS